MGISKIRDITRTSIPFVVSAVMLTVIQAPFTLGALAWVSMVPFIVAALSGARTWRLVWVSYLVSVAYWLGNVYWVGYVTVPAYIVFCLYLGLYWPMLVLCLRYCRGRFSTTIPLFVVAAFLITGAEAWQGIIFTGFNWRLLAHSQYTNLSLIQIADIFGELGVSFLVAMVNGLVAELWLSKTPGPLRGANMLKIIFVVAVLAATMAYGNRQIARSVKYSRKGPSVGAVQPNIPSHVKEMNENGRRILLDLINLSDKCFDAGAILVAWPETIVLTSLNPGYRSLCTQDSSPRQFDELIRGHVAGKGYVITGAHATDVVFLQDGEPKVTNQYNSAFLYRPDATQDPQRYDKIHLVPFGEYIPFRYTVPLFYKLVMSLSPYDFDYQLTRGVKYTTFEIDHADQKYHFGVLICYEDTDAEVVRRMAVTPNGDKKADWIVNVSNDGWYVRYRDDKVIASTEQAQRAVITVFRAIENRVSIVRAVNTGISCMVDPLGRIHDSYSAGDLPEKTLKRQGISGWFVDDIIIDGTVTFFSRHGGLLKRLCAAMTALLVVAMAAGYALEGKRKGTEK